MIDLLWGYRKFESHPLRQTFIDDKGLPPGSPFRHTLVILSSQKIAEKRAWLSGAERGTGKLMILGAVMREQLSGIPV